MNEPQAILTPITEAAIFFVLTVELWDRLSGALRPAVVIILIGVH